MNPDTLASLLTALGGIVGGGLSIAFEILAKYFKKKNQQDREDIATKIKSISDSLNKSAAELVDMQKELKDRITFVEQLNEQAKKAEDIASLNKEQVDAINEILSDNLKKEGRRSFWQGVLVNFIFFVLGAVASYLISIFLL